ncbi:MAG TPA: hypothetical protein VMU03_01835 [Gammaproteobacteria bacterium]|nr:hypothetical protein [Gammaproteobacteria bacterium]
MRPVLHWPGVPTLCVLAAALVIGIEFLPRSVFDVTMSVEARSEVVELALDPQREYVWELPAGSYSLLVAKPAEGCNASAAFEVVCRYPEPSYLTIRHGATVRLEALPPGDDGDDGPRFIVSIMPLEPTRKAAGAGGEKSTFEIRSARDELRAATTELVSYESGAVKLWRIPLVLRRVQIGESLAENVIAPDTSTARQPIMTEGNVRIFARRVFGGSNRYEVQEEHFDPADIVQIPGERERGNSLLLGLLSLNGGERAFDVTLHTEFAKVYVRRLGAEHAIGASMWSIVSHDPASLALWAALVSLISVANYHSGLRDKRAASLAAGTPPKRRWLAKRR